MEVLSINGNPEMQSSISVMLQHRGYTILPSESAEHGIECTQEKGHDCIILNPDFIQMKGTEIISRIRSLHVTTPIIVVSRVSRAEYIISALKAGADDYVTLPCNMDELSARIQAVVRRSQNKMISSVKVGYLMFNFEKEELTYKENLIPLTKTDITILTLLFKNPGIPVSTKDIYLALYPERKRVPIYEDLKIIHVFIFKLRKKIIEASKGIDHIANYHGRGYSVELPKKVAESA